MKKFLILLTLFIVTLFMTGCQEQKIHFGCNGQTGILGKWEYLGTDAPKNHTTFKENGECTTQYFYGNGTDYIVEKYSIDGKKIKFFLIEENYGSKVKKYSPKDTDFYELEYELSGDSLILKNRIYVKTTLFKDQSKTAIYKDAIFKKITQ